MLPRTPPGGIFDIPPETKKHVDDEIDVENEPEPIITLVEDSIIPSTGGAAPKIDNTRTAMNDPLSKSTSVQSNTGTVPKNLFPSYEELKRMEMEEDMEKLRKELRESRDYSASILRNNLLVPHKNQDTKRNTTIESFELKRPVPKKLKENFDQGKTDIIAASDNLNRRTRTEHPTRMGEAQNNYIPSLNERSANFGTRQGRSNAQSGPFTNLLPSEPIRVNRNDEYDRALQNALQLSGARRPQNLRDEAPNHPGPNRYFIPDEVRARSSFLRRLKTIPAFNGGTYNELRDFFDVVDTLFITIQNDIEESEFYDQLLLQIRGEARSAIESLQYTEWPLIKEKLQTYFAHLANKDIINSKLENLRQEKDKL